MINKTIKVLVLEDNEERIKQFRQRFTENGKFVFDVDYVDTAVDCIDKLDKNEYNIFFADHDLGGKIYVDTKDKNTGSEVARWIHDNLNKVEETTFIIHSLNFPGVEYMKSLLPNSIHIPFVWIREKFSQINFGEEK